MPWAEITSPDRDKKIRVSQKTDAVTFRRKR